MQWFTEFMELFLSVWELIKTLNLYLPASLSTSLRAAGAKAQRTRVLCLSCVFLGLRALPPGPGLVLLPAVRRHSPRSQGVPTQSWVTS